MNLILCEPSEVDTNGVVTLTGARGESRSRRAGRETRRRRPYRRRGWPQGTGEILALDEDRVVLRSELDATVPEAPAVDLLLALPRPKVLRRLWAQLAALGVGRIVLTNAARVERHYFDTHVVEASTYRPLLIEGLQQAGDTRLPHVSIHRQFRILVEDELDALSNDGARLVAHPGSHRSLLSGRARITAAARAARDRARGRMERLRAGPADAPQVRHRQHGTAHPPDRHGVRRLAGAPPRRAAAVDAVLTAAQRAPTKPLTTAGARRPVSALATARAASGS